VSSGQSTSSVEFSQQFVVLLQRCALLSNLKECCGLTPQLGTRQLLAHPYPLPQWDGEENGQNGKFVG